MEGAKEESVGESKRFAGPDTVTPRYFHRGHQAGLRARKSWSIAFPGD